MRIENDRFNRFENEQSAFGIAQGLGTKDILLQHCEHCFAFPGLSATNSESGT
jgi:hypothetical protein